MTDHRILLAEKQKAAVIGKKFHKLTIISYHSKEKGYNCLCECGNETFARPGDLKAGRRKSCGCLPKPQNSPGYRKSLPAIEKITSKMIGLKFNSLTVIKHSREKKAYECLCECGKTVYAKGWALKSGRHISCGCAGRNPLLPDHMAAKNDIYSNYKRAAKKRGYEFLLTKEQFIDLILGACHYCGTVGSLASSAVAHKDFRHNGVDRVDNSIGYVKENTVSCCAACNRSKGILGLEAWAAWLRASFEGLTTFQEVNIWDSEAKRAAEDIATLGRALLDRRIEFVEMIASYKATTTDSENLKSARLEKSFAVINILDREIKALPMIHDHLMSCAERTPGSKKEQALLLRELRTEKKELQAEKKAIKTGATQIKRDARQQASEAGYVDGIFGQYYASKVATWERRAIRRAKEAALGPHEDAMMAVDRQIDTVEKKITWLRRFGEGVVDPDDID